MSVWYDCLRLNNRTLTDHEKKNLGCVHVKCVTRGGCDWIGPQESRFDRPLFVEFTHRHNIGDLLALLCCYVDPTVKSLHDYPQRHLLCAAARQVDHNASLPASSEVRPSQE